jgi:hypothetical protein
VKTLIIKFDLDSIQEVDRSGLNKDVLGLHPKNLTSTSLVFEDYSTN